MSYYEVALELMKKKIQRFRTLSTLVQLVRIGRAKTINQGCHGHI